MKYIPFALILTLLAFLGYVTMVPKPSLPPSMEGKPVPLLQLPIMGGAEGIRQTLSFEGHYTLLNIFASWCAVCIQEQPALLALQASSKLDIVGIAWRDKEDALHTYLSTYGNPYQTIALDPAGEAIIALGVTGAPESFLISPGGIILYHHIGVLTTDVIDQKLLPKLLP